MASVQPTQSSWYQRASQWFKPKKESDAAWDEETMMDVPYLSSRYMFESPRVSPQDSPKFSLQDYTSPSPAIHKLQVLMDMILQEMLHYS